MIRQFLVEDVSGSLIELAYFIDNPEQFWVVMIEDILTSDYEAWFEKAPYYRDPDGMIRFYGEEYEQPEGYQTKAQIYDFSLEEVKERVGYIPPDTFVGYDEYCDFNLKVFVEMARAFNDHQWNAQHPVQYNDFLDILYDAEMIEYDSEGIPRWREGV